jgi:predicted ribosomally synthesized peptide with SipW-like signal peptide
MNKKILKAGLAGTAVVAIAAGGGTWSSWSDFHVDSGNSVGADHLSLQVNESATKKFDNVKLAPGEERDVAFYVASRDGDAVPNATLSLTLENLVPTENGCDSNSEAYAESGGAISDKSDAAAPCNQGGPGQFAEQSLFYVQATKMTDPTQCTTSTPMGSKLLNTKLSAAEGVPVDLLGSGITLGPGEGACVLAHVFMPDNASQYGFAADNKSQGDQATFDVRFDLTQVH